MNKDKIQKVVASVLLLGVLIYAYFAYLIGPLGEGMEQTRSQIDEMQSNVRKADNQILATRNMEEQGRQAEEFLTAAERYFREGTPIAWFPPMMKTFFERQGVDQIMVSSTGASDFESKALDGYENLKWDIQLPAVGFFQLGNLLAAIENEQPFMRVQSLSIGRTAADPQYQRVGMQISFVNREYTQ